MRNYVAKHAKRCGSGRHGGQAKYSRKVKHKHYSEKQNRLAEYSWRESSKAGLLFV